MKFVKTERYGDPVYMDEPVLEFKGKLASILIEKWGMVMSVPNGEDRAGRQKMTNATPEQIVERACNVAELTANEFTKRGWFHRIPEGM